MLTFNSKSISYFDIEGFYQSSIDYKDFSQKVIIILLNNKRKLILLQSNYLNFNEIESNLFESKLPYLGKKEFSWTYIE